MLTYRPTYVALAFLVALALLIPGTPPVVQAQGGLPQTTARPARLLRDLTTFSYTLLPTITTYGREARLSFGDDAPDVIETDSVFFTTDGTSAGTRREGNSVPGKNLCAYLGQDTVSVGGRTIFCIREPFTNKDQLWGATAPSPAAPSCRQLSIRPLLWPAPGPSLSPVSTPGPDASPG